MRRTEWELRKKTWFDLVTEGSVAWVIHLIVIAGIGSLVLVLVCTNLYLRNEKITYTTNLNELPVFEDKRMIVKKTRELEELEQVNELEKVIKSRRESVNDKSKKKRSE